MTFFRVPLLIQQSSNSTNFGLASKMIFLMWSVCGGFLLYFLTSNYLSVLIKPSYDKPVETAEDVIARNLTILGAPNTHSMKLKDMNSPFPIVRQLAEKTYVTAVLYLLLTISCKLISIINYITGLDRVY